MSRTFHLAALVVIALITAYDVYFFYQYRLVLSEFECNVVARALAQELGPQAAIGFRITTTVSACGMLSFLRLHHLRIATKGVLTLLAIHVALGAWYVLNLSISN